MSREQRAGSINVPVGRIQDVRVAVEGRVCKTRGCKTRLSKYNIERYCHMCLNKQTMRGMYR